MATSTEARLKELFPIKQKYAYFMSSASGPLPKSTFETLQAFDESMMTESSAAFPRWLAAMEATRTKAAQLLDCSSKSVAFVKNTGVGLWIASRMLDWREGDEILLPRGEFPSNIHPWLSLEPLGVKIRWLEPESPNFHRPRVTPEAVAAAITEKTRLLTVSFVQYDDGCRRDVNALGKLCKERGIVFVVDAIQGLGALPFSCVDCHADFVSAGSQKWMLSPPGNGLFYVAPHWLEEPRVPNFGWLSVRDPYNFNVAEFAGAEERVLADARRFEEGTANYAGIAAIGASLEFLLNERIDVISNRIKLLTDRLCGRLLEAGCEIISPREGSYWSGIVSFTHPAVPAKQIDKAFQQANIITTVRHDWLRVAVHYFNDEGEIDRLVDVLRSLVKAG